MRLAVTSVLAAVLAFAAVAADEERASTKQAELLVKKAVEYLKKNGQEKAFAAFNDPKGPFTFRDLYIAAYDMDGKCMAHGQKRERIGKNMLHDKDPDGKEFIAERVKVAKEKGKGWQEYKFMNPATKRVEQKVAYFERVDDVIVMCGAYRK